MRPTTHTPHPVRNIAGARGEDEPRGSGVPAGAVVDELPPEPESAYEPPDGAAEIPESIPRGGAVRD